MGYEEAEKQQVISQPGEPMSKLMKFFIFAVGTFTIVVGIMLGLALLFGLF